MSTAGMAAALDEAARESERDRISAATIQQQYEAGKKAGQRPLFGPGMLIAGFAGAAYLAVRFARTDKPLSHKLLDARIKSQGALITVLALAGLYSYVRGSRPAESFHASSNSLTSRYGSSLANHRVHPWWQT